MSKSIALCDSSPNFTIHMYYRPLATTRVLMHIVTAADTLRKGLNWELSEPIFAHWAHLLTSISASLPLFGSHPLAFFLPLSPYWNRLPFALKKSYKTTPHKQIYKCTQAHKIEP